VRTVLQERRAALSSLWAKRAGASAEELAGALEAELAQATRTVLARLYPSTAAPGGDPAPAPAPN
jgi:hypothetical protein